MKILYMQQKAEDSVLSKPSLLSDCGIHNCFLRFADSADLFSTLSPKMHQHAFTELHLIISGQQQYQLLNTVYTISAGHFLLIPAEIPHQHLFTQPGTRKYSFSFSADPDKADGLAAFLEKKLVIRAAPKAAIDALDGIEIEADSKREYSLPLVESKLFQFFLYLARDSGISEGVRTATGDEDPRLRLARQYIADNIESAISCDEVASYCHLSQKQLSRLFQRALGVSTADFIRSQRVLRIRQILSESDDTLEQISEKMHFSNVYHFNTFFSKYAGVAPGRFRKMHTKAGL